MLIAHQRLGLSDALLAADNPGERPAHGYNLLLAINMYVCLVATVLHVLKWQRKAHWMILRLLVPTIILLLGILTL
jgi:hypothetical protein